MTRLGQKLADVNSVALLKHQVGLESPGAHGPGARVKAGTSGCLPAGCLQNLLESAFSCSSLLFQFWLGEMGLIQRHPLGLSFFSPRDLRLAGSPAPPALLSIFTQPKCAPGAISPPSCFVVAPSPTLNASHVCPCTPFTCSWSPLVLLFPVSGPCGEGSRLQLGWLIQVFLSGG